MESQERRRRPGGTVLTPALRTATVDRYPASLEDSAPDVSVKNVDSFFGGWGTQSTVHGHIHSYPICLHLPTFGVYRIRCM
ncbi:hypothetical protein GWI33_018990 [Rhynchophorus ferrugineus]|uniref:Uncharacterized protein n=1 Tax=Rhynchophorus ferrugineus TaxID=354439 RepID=A0A834HUQ2_RHYFE|nr:hypothetical protein GWI33_018990 [Rhynchophorus ferrugineus]